MGLAIQCPSCGAEHSLRNPGITVIACEYCSATLYREEAGVIAGKKSIVAEPSSNLRVDKAGRAGKYEITIIGRVQFEHATGRWNEWYVDAGGFGSLWLVEDEKTYALEWHYTGELSIYVGLLSVGDTFELDDAQFEVRELGDARCLGAEGQLPRAIRPGESYRYIDCVEVSGNRVASIEVGPLGREIFIGEAVRPEDVVFAPEDFDIPEEIEMGTRHECPNCGGELELPTNGEPCKTLGCSYCEALVTLSSGTAIPAGLRKTNGDSLDLELGATGVLSGIEWEVMGRLIYSESEVDDEDGLMVYFTREYLLWNSESGYGWLVDYDGNWTLQRPTTEGPVLSKVVGLSPKSSVQIEGENYRVGEKGTQVLDYVDGALPWLARIGETHKYLEILNPPLLFTFEWKNDEVERFLGTHIDTADIEQAFGFSMPLARPSSQGAAAPNAVGPTLRATAKLAILFGIFNVFLGRSAMPGLPTTGFELDNIAERLGPDALLVDQDGRTEAFEVPENIHTLWIKLSTRVDNSWTYITADLLSADGKTLMGTVGTEVSYYHGSEGGERWTEGSPRKSLRLKAPPPGKYQIQIFQEAEKSPKRVTGAIVLGNRDHKYPFSLAAMFFCYAFFVYMGWKGRENQRVGL